jgi:hypothetical protein
MHRKIILKQRFFLQQWHEAKKRLNLMEAKLFSDYLRRFLKHTVSETETTLLRHERTPTHSRALPRFLVNPLNAELNPICHLLIL